MMNGKTEKAFAKNEYLSEFARYSSLSTAGAVGLSCYILADTFFVAKGLGADGIAALNLALPVFSLINGSGLMIGMGGGARYSMLDCAKKEARNRVFSHSFCLAAVLAAVFLIVGIFLSEPLSLLLGADEAVFAMTETYLRVLLLFSPAFLLNSLLQCFVRNDNAPRLSMTAMLTGSFSNILLDYIFIFPCKMGIFGAVLATGLAPVISIAVLSLHFIRRKNGFSLRGFKASGRLTGDILSAGLPSFVTEMSSGTVIIVFNMILLSLLGNTGVAAYAIVANISLVAVSVFTGMSQGVQPLLCRSFGRGDKNAAGLFMKYALAAVLAVSLLIYSAVLLFAPQIVSLFNKENDLALLEIAVSGLRIYFAACPFVGFNILICVYFTSRAVSLPANIISLARGFVIIIPAAFFLSELFGITGVWLAFPAAEALTAAAAAVLFLRRKSS